MTTLAIVLLVAFTVVMLVWLLAMLGVGIANPPSNPGGWLAWFACLILGLAVFVVPVVGPVFR